MFANVTSPHLSHPTSLLPQAIEILQTALPKEKSKLIEKIIKFYLGSLDETFRTKDILWLQNVIHAFKAKNIYPGQTSVLQDKVDNLFRRESWQDLPEDFIIETLDYLTMREAYNFSTTCSALQKYLSTIKSKFDGINKSLVKFHSIEELQSYLVKYKITHLNLIETLDRELIKNESTLSILQECPSLVRLNLSNSPCSITDDFLKKIEEFCPHLKELHINGCHKYSYSKKMYKKMSKRIWFEHKTNPYKSMRKVGSHKPFWKTIKEPRQTYQPLAQCSSFEELEKHLSVDGKTIVYLDLPKIIDVKLIDNEEKLFSILKKCPYLTHLNLSGSPCSITDEVVDKIFESHPHMTELNLEGPNYNCSQTGHLWLMHKLNALQLQGLRIYFGGEYGAFWEPLQLPCYYPPKKCSSLEELHDHLSKDGETILRLDLPKIVDISFLDTKEKLFAVLEKCPHITHLNLKGCPCPMTDECLQEIIKKYPNIVELNIKGCPAFYNEETRRFLGLKLTFFTYAGGLI